LILKLRYAYECSEDDEESIEIMFGQTFFDYFMGRIRVPLRQLAGIAACIKKLQFLDQPDEWKKCYPEWASRKFTSQ
jgi:hypothetical protein